MQNGDLVGGLIGVVLVGGVAAVVVLLEWGMGKFWKWLRRPRLFSEANQHEGEARQPTPPE
jgi:hypothetical protein